MSSWIKLHRKILRSNMYKSLTSKQRDVLIVLLLSVNYKENSWEWEGEVFTCQPGQSITSLDSIMKDCAKDVKVQSVRTALLKLEKWGFLTNISTKTGRLITIINWDRYQASQDIVNKDDNEELTKIQQRSNKELTPIKEGEETEEGKEESIRGEKNATETHGDDVRSDHDLDNGNHDEQMPHNEKIGQSVDFIQACGISSHDRAGNESDHRSIHRGGTLNGSFLDNPGPGINDNNNHDNSGSSVGDSSPMHGLPASSSMDEKNSGVDREKAGEKIDDNDMEAKKPDEAKPPAAKTKKNGKKAKCFDLDLSQLDPQFNRDIVDEFIEYRKTVKKDPMTQRSFNGVTRNAKSTSERHGGSFNDALVYAMENKWLTPDPKYIDDNKARFVSFLDEQHGPRSSDKEINAKIADLERRARIAQEKWDREHGAVNA